MRAAATLGKSPMVRLIVTRRDGRWIYFGSNRTGRAEIWRAPGAGGRAEQVTNDGGITAVESTDGATLYYRKMDLCISYASRRPAVVMPASWVFKTCSAAVSWYSRTVLRPRR